MPRHSTLGFEIYAPPLEAVHVVVGDLSRLVSELDHAAVPLKGMREIISSSSYGFAARRYLREMESNGTPVRQIIQKMNELTPFFRLTIRGELAILPPGSALKATNPKQLQTCESALLLARRGAVEGFELRDPTQERPRLMLLNDAFGGVVDVIDCQRFVPAHFLPHDGTRELFRFGQ